MLAFLFVDGLGLSNDPRSPLQRLDLPTLRVLSGGFSSHPFTRSRLAYRVLDARLSVEGLPQSGTGQTALLTGINAAQILGYHQGPHPLSKLQMLLRQDSLQVWAVQRGLRVLHANGYRQDYLKRVTDSRRNLLSAFGFAAQMAGLELLPLEHPHALLPAYWPEPEKAGQRFAQTAQQQDLTILENWALDYTAHRLPEKLDERFVELDRFLEGFLNASPQATLILTSDHGNAEEPWHTQHTYNPVPLIIYGPQAHPVPDMQTLTDLLPWLMEQLG
ncbi:alkaline phosphatase family protein [uncultured Meiothermus sp.]|uniref:alkaline phosphatase family protein n=1 Tax=uncultured Meiothermus sp. TaxID=157471 RepID=UPI00260BBFE0|nr:alkaline phosphatase family protein [uncultured Meiothermus sp.]